MLRPYGAVQEWNPSLSVDKQKLRRILHLISAPYSKVINFSACQLDPTKPGAKYVKEVWQLLFSASEYIWQKTVNQPASHQTQLSGTEESCQSHHQAGNTAAWHAVGTVPSNHRWVCPSNYSTGIWLTGGTRKKNKRNCPRNQHPESDMLGGPATHGDPTKSWTGNPPALAAVLSRWRQGGNVGRSDNQVEDEYKHKQSFWLGFKTKNKRRYTLCVLSSREWRYIWHSLSERLLTQGWMSN